VRICWLKLQKLSYRARNGKMFLRKNSHLHYRNKSVRVVQQNQLHLLVTSAPGGYGAHGIGAWVSLRADVNALECCPYR